MAKRQIALEWVEDAMFIWLAPEGAKVAETAEVAPGIILDYDAAGTVIELLDVSKRVRSEKLQLAAE